MSDFYVLPAHVLEGVETVAAVGAKGAAKKAAERDSIEAGRVVVIAAEGVAFKTIVSSTTVEASDP